MNKRRFFVFTVFLFFLFVFAFGSGCGGGVSSISDNNSSPNQGQPDNPDTDMNPSILTITFDSQGGSYVDDIILESGEIPVEPDEPTKDSNTFAGWFDDEGYLFAFDAPISQDILLTAKWVETLTATTEELTALRDVEPGGTVSVSFDSADSPIVSVDVSYTLDGAGLLDIAQVKTGSLMKMTGLIGTPVDINIIGDGKVKNATITFGFEPSKLSSDVNANNLGIVWYDESNDMVVPLSSDVVGNTIVTSVDHFSMYAVVNTTEWLKVWRSQLPKIRTNNSNFNVIILLDCSGSMYGTKMQKTIEAAQGLIDSLADNDCVSIAEFTSYVYDFKLSNGDYRIKLVKDGHNYRQEIKDWIGKLRASGGTDIQGALNYALTASTGAKEEGYQSVVILLSDGQSSVSDIVLQNLKNNGLSVISVGVGTDVSAALMQKIADRTGGKYIYSENAEDLKYAFDEIQGQTLGISSDDNDGDGLEDALERSGMKDQYDAVWFTDATLKDTDGDKLLDGEEMGKKIYRFFSRVSNPNLPTFYSPQAYVTVSDKMSAIHDFTSKSVILDIDVTDCRYAETKTSETFYQPASNLSVELVNVPSVFTISQQPKVNYRKEIDKKTGKERIEYTATLSYSGSKVPEVQFINWKITAGNIQPIEKQMLLDMQSMPIQSGILETARLSITEAAQEFIDRMTDGINEKTSSATNKLVEVQEVIRPTVGDAPDEVYAAFALAILEAAGASKVDAYESDMPKLVNQVYNQIRGGIKSSRVNVVVDNVSYSVDFNIYAMSGVFVGWADVKSNGRSIAYLTAANGGTKDGTKALAEYCAILAQLNTDVWKEFVAYYASDIANLVGVKGITKDKARDVLDKTEKVIKALCDKNAADDLIQKMGEAAKKKFKSFLWDTSSKKLRKFIENMVPGGSNLMKSVDTLKNALDKFEKYEKRTHEYAFAAENRKEDAYSFVKKTYEEFKSVYDKLSGIDIFKNCTPVSEWPSNW
ncbi:MAG: VWA domain-containing protein [Synergistaceae bacterium]|nr:VWA domain-containing protein [Synergistaceae bacterium]MBR0233323.1 VWA domain-containing protein [Synergistaceae bacterium]